MKSRFVVWLLACLLVVPVSYPVFPKNKSASNSISLPSRHEEARASRGGQRTGILTGPFPVASVAMSEIVTTTTSSSVVSITTTTAPKMTTTTVKPRPVLTTKPKVSSTVKPAQPGKYMELISQYDWDVNHAYRIMMCESGGNPNAINRSSGATGLFQIHPGGSKYLDPATNVATAHAKYKAANGWGPWVCRG